jgi:lipid-binding SYLF domain-containing protein
LTSKEITVKKPILRATVLCAATVLVLASTTVSAEDDWKSLKQESKRMKIDETAQQSLDTLFADNAKAKDLYDKSYGWAVFDNLKLAFGFSGGGGNGVAVQKETGEKTYMQMGTAGVGIGLGANKYQIVFLCSDRKFLSFHLRLARCSGAFSDSRAGSHASSGLPNR